MDYGANYTQFKELMYYFNFEFFVYAILAIIVLICTLKSIATYISLTKNKNTSLNHGFSDLVISAFCGLGLFFAMFFQGVISDISLDDGNIWFYRVLTICIIAFSLFILQVVLFLVNKTKTNNITLKSNKN